MRPNLFLILDAGEIDDDDLRDHVSIYRGLLARLRVGPPPSLGVVWEVAEALAVLEGEAEQRGVEVGE